MASMSASSETIAPFAVLYCKVGFNISPSLTSFCRSFHRACLRNSNDENIAPFNNLTTGKAVTLVVERVPFPEAIESLQNLQFLRAGEYDGSEQLHRDGESQMSKPLRNQTNGTFNYR